MQYFKSIVGIFVLMCLTLPAISIASSFTSPLGSSGNPIYGTLQIIETTKQKEDKLIATFGYSEYNSCRASACGSGDMSNPSSQESCLMQVEYYFRAGICGRSAPNLTCQDGLMMQNGICVEEQQQSQTCPPNTVLENGSCMYYYPQTTETNLSENQICINDYGSQSIWTGERNEQGGVTCGCITGYDFIDDSGVCKYAQEQMKTLQAELSQIQAKIVDAIDVVGSSKTEQVSYTATDYNNACRESHGEQSIWTDEFNENGGIICGCSEGYDFTDDTEVCLPILNEIHVYVPADNDAICSNDYGSMSIWKGEINSKGGPVCECSEGYDFIDETQVCLPVSENEDSLGPGWYVIGGMILGGFVLNAVRLFRRHRSHQSN